MTDDTPPWGIPRPDSALTFDEVENAGLDGTLRTGFVGYWASDPESPVQDWQFEVANGDTRRGYWEWVAVRYAQED